MEKEKFDVKTARRLLSYFRQDLVRSVLIVVFILLSALSMVMASLFLQTLIDGYITPLLGARQPDFTPLFRALLRMGLIYIGGALCSLFYGRLMASVAQGIQKKIRDEMFARMQTLPIGYFDRHSHGDIMSHYTNDTDTLRQLLSQSIPQLLSSMVTVITVAAAMLSVSVWLTLMVVILMFGILRLVGYIAGRSSRYFIRQQTALGDVNGLIEEIIHGQKVVKVFGYEQRALARFYEKNDDLFLQASLANTYANVLMPVMNNLGYVIYVLIAVIGGTMGIAGVPNLSLSGMRPMTLGMIASFLILSRSFMQPLGQVSQQLSAVVMAMAGARRIFELMDEQPEQDGGYVTLVNVKEEEDGKLTQTKERTGMWAWRHPHEDGTVTYTRLAGDVRLLDVDFSYVPGRQVLRNMTLYAKPGQKVAFVGATGAGKTTITNLINRFYDIDGGKIRYDGINIEKIKKPELRRSLGIVLQDVHLFTGTVMENIRYGKLDATDEECIRAARLVHADGFIRMLPAGYDTMIEGEGGGLSQGQRQLISIARAAVADPPVMILDEATSSIDTRTETIVQRGMDSLMKGRTVFVIAHRLSTIKNADVIMVLDNGVIVERGSHEELMERKGRYYRLYTGMFEETA